MKKLSKRQKLERKAHDKEQKDIHNRALKLLQAWADLEFIDYKFDMSKVEKVTLSHPVTGLLNKITWALPEEEICDKRGSASLVITYLHSYFKFELKQPSERYNYDFKLYFKVEIEELKVNIEASKYLTMSSSYIAQNFS